MLKLNENERVALVIRKYWFVMAGPVITFVLALILPSALLTLLPFLAPGLDREIIAPAVNFFLSLYIMALLAFLYLIWADYYLDMWIVTSQRIIDIEQRGLFSRDVSEIPIDRVQDITIEVHGFFETMLKFGTIRIQTAGEREFVIHNVPRLYETKDAILKHQAAAKNPPPEIPGRL